MIKQLKLSLHFELGTVYRVYVITKLILSTLNLYLYVSLHLGLLSVIADCNGTVCEDDLGW